MELEQAIEALAKAIVAEDGDVDVVHGYAEDLLRKRVEELAG